ncbi:MAG TPA: translational GTPase TypA, partial [Pseudonocardiaceae bacterium]|nr:translational GTPase TypA [Pseudonocardiaceae bacterium]
YLTVDAPEEHLGVLTQLLASRKGQLRTMSGHGSGRVRLEYVVPARGLIGFRTEFLTETRGTGIMNHVFEGYFPWAGELRTRHTGSLVADRSGAVTGYALIQLADRGTFFVEPGADAYEGMVVGENPRAEDLDVNVCREKKLTNVRSSTADVLERLARPRKLGLEESLEFCASDECVEVTPHVVRIRKLVLDSTQRARQRGRARDRDQA